MNEKRRPLSDRQSRALRESLGKTYYTMINNRSVAMENVQHEDPIVRAGALTLLDSFWQLPVEMLLTICDVIIENDENARVRGRAMQILGRLCRGTRDPQRSKILANTALNAELPAELRSVAVFALQQINKDSDQSFGRKDVKGVQETVRALIDRGQALRDAYELRVDWNWVASFSQ